MRNNGKKAALKHSKTSTTLNEIGDFNLAEYAALRSEILKRSEIQHQLISMALIAAGTFLTVNFTDTSTIPLSSTVTLIYPLLAIFLAAAWAQNDYRVRQIGLYIKVCIEKNFLQTGLGWEHAGPSTSVGPFGSLTLFASRGVFIGTELLTVAVALVKIISSKKLLSTEDVVLIIADVVAVMLTIPVLRRRMIRFEHSLLRPTNPEKLFLLAADIDGTILGDEEGEINLKALFRDHSRRIVFAVITGRSLSSVQNLVRKKRIPNPDFIVGSAGTDLLDCGDSNNELGLRYAERVSNEWDLEKIYALGQGEGIRRQTFKDGQPRFQAGFFWDGRPETLAGFHRRLKNQSGCHIVSSSNKYIDVFPTNMGKGEAVKYLQRALGIDHGRVVVTGDSGNDREMFETSFKGIIPVNTLEELKKVVYQKWHYQSSLPSARGVIDGLLHFGFIDYV
ncbi:MAG: HAD family hydrolase [Anaerolineales bacterium]